jgi:hypothetical protein
MNGLLRDYFPKGTDLWIHTAERLDAVATELNDRPRKTLGWTIPAGVFGHHLPPQPDGCEGPVAAQERGRPCAMSSCQRWRV